VEREDHTGPIWRDGRVAPGLALALARPDSLTVIERGGDARIVLGVPHHAPVGIERIALDRPGGGRIADENAVLYALVCLDALAACGLGARLVVAGQARDHDPNKDDASPYCRAALETKASLLVECHGAGARAPHDLELSAGRNRRVAPLDVARDLAAGRGRGVEVAAQTRPGTSPALLVDASGHASPTGLRFPALRTSSLLAAERRGVAALHLEAKIRFRSTVPRDGTPTRSGARLGHALAAALAAHCVRSC
jgi:hypothetical protein